MKEVSVFFLIIVFGGLLITGCNGSNTASPDTHTTGVDTFDTTAMKKIIDEKNNQFTQAHIKRDTAFLNNTYTQDARVFAPNSEVITGRSAIAAINLEFVNFGINEFREETTALYGSGDYLINEGNYFMTYGKENTVDKGKFINIWKKVNNDWKLYSNIWNTNAPVATTK